MGEDTTVRAKPGRNCPSDVDLASYAAGGGAVGVDRLSASPVGDAARPGRAGAFDRLSASPFGDAARPGRAGAFDRLSASPFGDAARPGKAGASDLFEHLVECARCRAYVARRVVGAPINEGDLIGGRYRIEHLLASGGIGAVVRAVDTKLDRLVAIKLMLPRVASDPNVRKRFDLEARTAVKMRSEHVARVLDIAEVAGATHFIVFEYLEGEDLTALVQRRGPLPVAEACEYVLQACEAMAEAHSLGIVHRDLKPANLFLAKRPDGSSCIKVIDFGIAKTSSFGRDGATFDSATSLTHEKIVGTPRYMSPEQIKASDEVDARTDIWGLGTILYELLVGSCPFEADAVDEVFAKILHQTPAPPSATRPDVSRTLDGIVARCLDRKPEKRYASVAKLARAIAPFAPEHARVSAERAERVIAGQEKTFDDPPGSVSVRTPRTRRPFPRTPLMVLGVLGALALGLGIAWLVVPGRSTQTVAIGASCTTDDTCGKLACIEGTCTVRCTTNADCASPARCTSDGLCNAPLRVGFIYVGVPEDEGWTHTHDLGRKYAAAKLPYLETDYVSNVYRPEDVERAVDDLVARGFSVIVANSSSLAVPIARKAAQYPDTRFVAVMSYSPGPRVETINARMYEGWYLAGYAAAQRSRTHRLGYVGALATPEVVRDISAFTRGARAYDPKSIVEVRWLGFWFDGGPPDAQGRYKEEILAQQLLDNGCDVVANHADNERVVAAVGAAQVNGQTNGQTGAVSIANNNIDACERGPTTCLGVPYWNWGPLYVDLFTGIHRNTWKYDAARWDSLRANPEQSVVGFRVNTPVAGAAIALATGTLAAELAKPDGARRIFAGPFCSTGQRPACVRDGETLADDELRSMCWFVEGVVDAADTPAQVPASCAR